MQDIFHDMEYTEKQKDERTCDFCGRKFRGDYFLLVNRAMLDVMKQFYEFCPIHIIVGVEGD